MHVIECDHSGILIELKIENNEVILNPTLEKVVNEAHDIYDAIVVGTHVLPHVESELISNMVGFVWFLFVIYAS